MIVDYHVHTPYCGHAHGQTIQYVQTAIQKDITEIGFADHLGRYYMSNFQKHRYWDWGMSERDLARYFSEISDLREVFNNQIKIKIGLEIDYIEGAEEILLPILDKFPFDFYLGSIHCLPRFSWKHISDYQGNITEPIILEYFRLVKNALKSKLFHSIAHSDLIWRYIELTEHNLDIIFEEIIDTVDIATEHNTCLEVNANGFIWAAQSFQFTSKNPFNYYLDQIKHHNTPITIGSDAHEPFLVGKSFPAIITVLHNKGINNVSSFTSGKITMVPLG